jgi:hypothetical protein
VLSSVSFVFKKIHCQVKALRPGKTKNEKRKTKSKIFIILFLLKKTSADFTSVTDFSTFGGRMQMVSIKLRHLQEDKN